MFEQDSETPPVPVWGDGVDPMPPEIVALRRGGEPVWIFAYGSLMWNPEVPFAEMRPALLRGYHRSFCLYSDEYRGTRERPGLVLGLDRGGACRGMALRLAPDGLAGSLDHLWAREMTGGVYRMRRLRVAIGTETVVAHAFTIERDHSLYAGRLSLDATARIIRHAAGRRGSNRDYLCSTVRHLERLGLADGPLHRLERRVAELL
jgi:cation transport protein ChaC